MNSTCRRVAALLFCLLAACAPARADEALTGVVYIKNNGPAATVWINGYCQGIAPASRTCYTLVEGFVTSDSGFQPDGQLVLKDSHAGWNASRTVEFLAIAPEQRENETVNKYWTGTFTNAGKELWLWIGGGAPITDLDREFAGQIQKGGAGDLPNDAILKEGEPADDDEGMGGETKTGSRLPMMVASMAGIKITSPAAGYETPDRVVTVRGTVKDRNVSKVTLNVNGRESIVPVSGGEFTGSISMTVGENNVTARANQGKAKSKVTTVVCTDKPSQLWVELVWDGPGDVDLHTRQPNGEDVAYNNPHPAGGGQLDIDNTKGYGPEHYFISAARGDEVYAGTYSIYLIDYRYDGLVNCRVTIFKNEKLYDTYSGTFHGSSGDRMSIADVQF